MAATADTRRAAGVVEGRSASIYRTGEAVAPLGRRGAAIGSRGGHGGADQRDTRQIAVVSWSVKGGTFDRAAPASEHAGVCRWRSRSRRRLGLRGRGDEDRRETQVGTRAVVSRPAWFRP